MPDLRTQSELDVLTAIERGEVVTQMALTKRIGLSIGLVNAVLKRGMRKGFVKARQAPYKRYAYYLTPTGFGEKSRLVAEYLDGSLQFYRKARSEYAALFATARAQGKKRLALAGAGELAEIAILAAWSADAALLGIIDWRACSEPRYGLKTVRAIGELGPLDGVVVTDARCPQRLYDELLLSMPDAAILAPDLLRITRDVAALAAAAKDA